MNETDSMSITVKHPDWLVEAAKSAESTFHLIAIDRVPESIKGWFVVTKCLHLLRCVYGSDLETLTALRAHVMAKELEQIEITKQLENAPECPECKGPMFEMRNCFGPNPSAYSECMDCGFRR